MNKTRFFDLILLGFFLYLLILQVEAIWPFTIDDMYISLRYAKHWAEGLGLLWNIDEPPVEGYSNFSFVTLASMALLLKISPVFVLKMAGFLGLGLTVFIIFLISRFFLAGREAFLACLCVLLYKGQIIWSVSGLETTVYQALLTGSIYFTLRGLGWEHFPLPKGIFKPAFLFMAGLCLALSGFTRPEAPAFMLLYFFVILWGTKNLRALVLFCLPILCLYLPYFLWRWHYYGLIFPNPVYCKGRNQDFTFQLDMEYLELIWPFILCSLPAFVYTPKDLRLYCLGLPSLVYLILLYQADPIVAFENRLFLPAFVLLIPLVLHSIRLILLKYFIANKSSNSPKDPRHEDKYYRISYYISVACFALVFIPMMRFNEYRDYAHYPLAGENLRREILYWLKKNTYSTDTVVLADSGMVPYYSNLKFIDSYCLNNKAMGQLAENQRYEQFCQQIFNRKPKILILTSLSREGLTKYTPADACLKNLILKKGRYRLAKQFSYVSSQFVYRYELFKAI